MMFRNVVTAMIALVLSTSVNAATVRIDYTGVIDRVDDALSSGAVQLGQSFSGYFTFDTTIQDDSIYEYFDSAGEVTVREAHHQRAVQEAYTNVSGTEYLFNSGQVYMYQYVTSDTSTVGITGQFPVIGETINNNVLNSIQLAGLDFSGIIPIDTPPSANILSAFDLSANPVSLYMWFNPTGSAYNIGSIQTITVSAVPIPAAIWLFSSGLIGLIGLARRKVNV